VAIASQVPSNNGYTIHPVATDNVHDRFAGDHQLIRSVVRARATPSLFSLITKEILMSKPIKQRYLTPAGKECTILRETDSNVTLLIDDPEYKDSFEWTTDRPNFVKRYKPITITLYFSDGTSFRDKHAGTNDEIVNYYLGKTFDGRVVLCVHIPEVKYKMGLMVRSIENDETDRIASVRVENVKVDATKSFDEVMLSLYSGAVYALKDVWVYDLKGEWLNTIGYQQETVRR
jgi:hypothetical protein